MLQTLVVPALVALLVLGSDAAAADSPNAQALSHLAGTIFTKRSPVFAEGRLDACTIEYRAVTQDWVYAQGSYIVVDGEFGFHKLRDKLVASLKVVVNDIVEEDLSKTPNVPTRAYFISSALQTTLDSIVGSYPSDIPGAIFVVFKPEVIIDIILKALAERQITIAFNKGNGGTDIRLNLDLSVLSTQDGDTRVTGSKTIDEFSACLGKLVR